MLMARTIIGPKKLRNNALDKMMIEACVSGEKEKILYQKTHFLNSSDGRVSDNTIKLIRALLVLNPRSRKTAAEVLDSLRTIIATW